MKKIAHKSAEPSHYNKEANNYDLFNENNSLLINATIEKMLRKKHVSSVLDLACGTGSQVFFLHQKGFTVAGYDINAKMLRIARGKAKQQNSSPAFHKGDIRTTKAGKFDAVITIFNAIGHLTKNDFNSAIANINGNLNPGGIYVFDIFNLDYLLDKDNITKLTIDWLKRSKDKLTREIQYSTIDTYGILRSYDHYHEQVGLKKAISSTASQTLQIYNAQQLKELLAKHGFSVIKLCGIDGSRFSRKGTERILTIAKKN